MKRTSAAALMLLIFFYGFGHSAHAAPELEYADASIKETIEADLKAQYVSSLNTEKEYFKTDGDFNEAILGEGVAVYQIELEDLSFEQVGYEFPLIVNDKVVATILAEQVENKWSITNISSLSSLPSDLEQAQQQADADGVVQYIHDKRYKTRGFLIQNNEQEVFLDMSKNQIYDMDTFYQVFDTYKADRMNLQMRDSSEDGAIQVGGGGPQFPNASTPDSIITLLLAGIAAILLGVGLLLGYKWRKAKN